MPQTVTIGAFVLGAVLLLVGLFGGKVKIFNAEVDSSPGRFVRVFATILGLCLVLYGIARESDWFGGTQAVGSTATPERSQVPARSGGADDIKSSSVGNTPPASTLSATVAEPMDISGYWYDSRGAQYEIRQQGQALEFTAVNPDGSVARGSGDISGNQVRLRFTVNGTHSGSGEAVISSDGRQISGSYYDNVNGQYSNTIYRER